MSTNTSIPTNPGSNPMFNFEGKDFRAVSRNNAPWFVAMDYARATKTYITKDGSANTSMLVRGLDQDEYVTVAAKEIGGSWGRGVAYVTLLSESGLYKVMMRANHNANPVVARFQNWVTREVLPALRKDGMYVMGEEKVKTGARVKSSGPGLLRPATSSRPLALQHQGEDGGCILGCPTYETRSTIAAFCGV